MEATETFDRNRNLKRRMEDVLGTFEQFGADNVRTFAPQRNPMRTDQEEAKVVKNSKLCALPNRTKSQDLKHGKFQTSNTNKATTEPGLTVPDFAPLFETSAVNKNKGQSILSIRQPCSNSDRDSIFSFIDIFTRVPALLSPLRLSQNAFVKAELEENKCEEITSAKKANLAPQLDEVKELSFSTAQSNSDVVPPPAFNNDENFAGLKSTRHCKLNFGKLDKPHQESLLQQWKTKVRTHSGHHSSTQTPSTPNLMFDEMNNGTTEVNGWEQQAMTQNDLFQDQSTQSYPDDPNYMHNSLSVDELKTKSYEHRPNRVIMSNKTANTRTSSAKKSSILERSKPLNKLRIEPEFEKPSADYYQNLARTFRNRASDETDRIRQTLLDFESVVYYIAAAIFIETGEIQYQHISDSANFFNRIVRDLKKNLAAEGHFGYFRNRIKALDQLIGSCLAFRLYSIRRSQAYKNYEVLTKFERDNANLLGNKSGNGGRCGNSLNTGSIGSGTTTCSTTTPSPTASTPGSSQSLGMKEPVMVPVPADIYLTQSQQIRILNQLMWSENMWSDAVVLMKLQDNREFFNGLNDLCGPIERECTLEALSEYLLTATRWLQREHGLKMEAQLSYPNR